MRSSAGPIFTIQKADALTGQFGFPSSQVIVLATQGHA